MRWLGYSIGSAGILAFVVLAGVDWLADLRDDASAFDVPARIYADLAVLIVIGWTMVALGKRWRSRGAQG